ncbi:MAG: hypothetical protein RMY62_002135 [Nostoc sp. ZfuVER08]|jgi:hypothetical protein|uniref:Uncharacterized protein n=1 Tax=Nostoc punctiforme FACHB-252 TaxID=1357509 RepID=A0ABR8H4D2_NOSPU|nr:hypothetical protein [Nostoc punctiforme]MBD2610045.1 hypothetical protein [Nostoc punctiforme FACHB-252]MBL1200030.1 hypothetical protein [Nostoc sp. GBBB01]MDZ8013670.1 hypothetical protein [Nostoc sp. ZfuVER08]
MAKIVIYTLLDNQIKEFFHKLTLEKLEAILGGFYPAGFHIVNITDSVGINPQGGDNTYEAVNHSISYHDNKINSIDYSRSIYNNFL